MIAPGLVPANMSKNSKAGLPTGFESRQDVQRGSPDPPPSGQGQTLLPTDAIEVAIPLPPGRGQVRRGTDRWDRVTEQDPAENNHLPGRSALPAHASLPPRIAATVFGRRDGAAIPGTPRGPGLCRSPQGPTARLSNPTGERAVASRSTAVTSWTQTHGLARGQKWLLEPWQTLEIPGWQISATRPAASSSPRPPLLREVARRHVERRTIGSSLLPGTAPPHPQPIVEKEKNDETHANRDRASADT
jgi:hypothetical protein